MVCGSIVNVVRDNTVDSGVGGNALLIKDVDDVFICDEEDINNDVSIERSDDTSRENEEVDCKNDDEFDCLLRVRASTEW